MGEKSGLLTESGFDQTVEIFNEYCESVIEDNAKRYLKFCNHFIFNKYNLEEIKDNAAKSICFHEDDELYGGGLDAYKYIAHLSFWFARLRPVEYKLINDKAEEKSISKTIDKEKFSGKISTWNIVDENDKNNLVEDNFNKKALNEEIAYQVACRMIDAYHLELQSKIVNVKTRNLFTKEIEMNKLRFKNTRKSVNYSLKTHFHTCRTWVLFLECMYKTNTEYELEKN